MSVIIIIVIINDFSFVVVAFVVKIDNINNR